MSATGQEQRLAWRNNAQPEPRRTTRARGVLVIVSAAVLSLICVVKGLLGVPIAGSLALFAGGVAIYPSSITSLSIMIASQISSMPQPVFILLSLLSGSTTPLGSMSDTLQRIMQFRPSTHFVSFAQTVRYRGAGLDVVWQDCGVTAALGLPFFSVALMRFRRMLVHIQA